MKFEEKAEDLYQKSLKLLKYYSFIAIAKKYFKEVNLVGSASVNLMVDADIDIDCQTQNIDVDIILKFVGELISVKECRKVSLYNQLFDDKPYFIINIDRLVFEDESWTITFFISNNLNNTPKLSNWLKEKLNDKIRSDILFLKDYRNNNNQKRSIPSHLIYEAVITNNVNNIEGFKIYLQEMGIDPEKKDIY